MLSKNASVAKSQHLRPTAGSAECLKPKHLSELAMPSPVSTPGAEHLSDVSSCCSVDDTDSNRSSPPGSPTNSLTVNSFSTPASDLKRKYKRELWSAIRSDYHYLMDEEIIDTCRSTESDPSFESDDQTSSVTVVSFKDFMQQYSELSGWLDAMLLKAKRQSNCLSEKYVNQTYHEEMLNHLMSLKLFKEYARQLIVTHPRLKDDIGNHLKQVNGMWETLKRLLLPNSNHSDQRKMLHDMELDFDGLRQWVDDMEVKRRTWRLHSHWTNDDIDRHLEIQRMLQAQIESHSRVVRALLSLCNRLTSNGDNGENGLKVSVEDQDGVVRLKEQVTEIQEELNGIWLNSIEWQMTLEDAKKNGIHLRIDASDDQWDRMRSTGQRKQTTELKTEHRLSSDFVGDKDTFSHNRLLHKTKSESENKSNVKKDDADVQISEYFTAVDVGGLERNSYLKIPVDCNSRSYSDPFLIGDSFDGDIQGHSERRRNLKTDPLNPRDSTENWENDFSKEYSPGQLRHCRGATDLMAAFCGEKKDVPVDVGYSSGSYSNEETDSSARLEHVIWSRNRRSNGSDKDSLVDSNEEAVVKGNFMNSFTDRCRNSKGAGQFMNPLAKVLTCNDQCLKAVDELSLPETEDEMSAELPLDDIPVVCSSNPCAEDSCGPLMKRPLAKMTTTFRRSLHFEEDKSTSDLDSWCQAEVSSSKAFPTNKQGPGRKLENEPKTSLTEKTNGWKKKNARLLCSSTPPSGSCYASSEGTESESDFLNHNLHNEKHKRKFGHRLKSRWEGSSSLRSSPVKELAETSVGRAPLKRRMSECRESIFSDAFGLEASRQWMSDSAISKLLREDAISPNKIPKMSAKTSEFLESKSVNAFHGSFRMPDGLVKHVNNDGDVPGKLKPLGHNVQTNVFTEPAERILHHWVLRGSEDDAVVPRCDSLNSSFTELTTDECQMYSSDLEKMVEEEMQWHDDSYRGDCFEGDVKKSTKGRDVLWGMDSDSDLEDFRHVLGESGKGLRFIETMIRQDYCFGESGVSSQDSSAFNEPLATCKTNIVCLQELIDALRSKNKMDGEILQVSEIVNRWQQLQSILLMLQKDSRRISEFQAEVAGLQMELQNMNAFVVCDDKFCNVQQLEEAVKALKAVQFELKEKTDIRLHSLESAYKQFVSDYGELNPQLFALGEQVEHLRKCRDSFAKRCEVDERRLQSALISWHQFNNLEKELNSLFQHCNRASGSQAAAGEISLEETGDLEAMRLNWKLLEEKLQQLSFVYLDFASVCSDSSALASKQAITLSSNQLQALRQTNDEKLIKLLEASQESFPEGVGHQAVATNSQALADCVVRSGNVSAVNSAVRPVNYVLPLALAFAFISCLYALFGDGWYELLGTVGLVLDPNLKHVRGPPPA